MAQREEPTAGLSVLRQELERTQEAHRARSAETIREELRGVLDRARPVAVEREGLGHGVGHEGQAHKERAHEEERDGAAFGREATG